MAPVGDCANHPRRRWYPFARGANNRPQECDAAGGTTTPPAERKSTVTAGYEIYVRGRLGPEMQRALADLHPQVQSGRTRLFADDVDQASLHGILDRLRDLALEVDSMVRTNAEAIE
jgi:hypothetical protein